MVELDVIALPDRSLVLGHSLQELAADAPTLDQALSLIAEQEGTSLLADVKQPGYESELVAALRRYDLVGRTLASSAEVRSLQALRKIEPVLMRGRTYPRDRLHLGKRRTLVPVAGPTLGALRAALPWRIGRLLSEVGAAVATLQHRLVSRAVVERCHAHGAAVLVWTVNDAVLVGRLDRLGVDGVIIDDLRVFAAGAAKLQA